MVASNLRVPAPRGTRLPEQGFQAVFDAAGLAIAVVGLDQRPVEVNRALVRLLGYPAEELVRMRFRDFTHPDDVELDVRLFHELVEGRRDHYQIEKRYLHRDGRIVWAKLTVSLLRDAAGRMTHALGLVEDITERKRAEEDLLARERRLAHLLEAIGEGVVTTDLENRILSVNPSFCSITGYAPDELVGRAAIELLVPAEDRPLLRAVQEERKAGRSSRYELPMLRKDGARIWVEISGTPLRNFAGDVIGTVGVVEDVTERKAEETRLEYLSTRDPLTDLLNRRGFELAAGREYERAARTGREMLLLYFDLNDFKSINDRFGHAEGDRALRDLAEVLKRCFRASDSIGRIGGDEFVALAVDTLPDSERVIVQRIEHALERLTAAGDRGYALSVSVGVARSAASPEGSLEQLLRAADREMYERKRARRRAPNAGA